MQEQSFSLVPHTNGLEELIGKTKTYIRGANSPATIRAYRTDFEDFTQFCCEHDLPFLPASPTTVTFYIADRADSLAAATITRRLTAVTKTPQAAGFSDSPSSSRHFVASKTLKGIRRAIGTAQHGKDPLLTADIRRIVESCPENLAGLRDKALILIGFAGAFRRSELAAIDVADHSFRKEGLVIDLRRSKTDQEASGRQVGIPLGSDECTCPVRAVRRWLTETKITEGPLLRAIDHHGHVASHGLHKDLVGWILKRAALRAGMKTEPLGGHSLRAGHVTQAAMNGVNERDIMRQTGHRSHVTLGKYIRIDEVFTRNAAAGLGI
ncbi:MAG: site-specific integrase [Terracidiphilus sp.]|jgi:integrase